MQSFQFIIKRQAFVWDFENTIQVWQFFFYSFIKTLQLSLNVQYDYNTGQKSQLKQHFSSKARFDTLEFSRSFLICLAQFNVGTWYFCIYSICISSYFMVCLILRITRTRSRLGYVEILFYSLSNASFRVISAEVPYLQVNARKSYCYEVRG